MSNTNLQDQENQEIDLGIIFKKVGDFFDKIALSIFKCILFFKKNALILISLIVIGAGLGYFLDSVNKSYEHEIIVSPNFGSTDYLYAKIELLESKIQEKDYNFFKKIGIENPEKISLIEIDPVIDIYSFVNNNTAIATNAQNTQNFELMKLLAEDSDIKKVIKDKLTSKNYPYHIIHIISNGYLSESKTIKPIFDYLNKNEHFGNIQKTLINNVKIKMKKNLEIISQIDNIINNYSSKLQNTNQGGSLVYYNENMQINDVINNKNALIVELGGQRLDLINLSQIIKRTSSTINIKNTKNINNKLKFVVPVLFVIIYIFYTLFISFYRNQQRKLNQA